jgi:hypothetical protein
MTNKLIIYINSGALKRSSLEKALVKVGAAATGVITYEQFLDLMDLIQGSIDINDLDIEEIESAIKKKDVKPTTQISGLQSSKVSIQYCALNNNRILSRSNY